MGKLKNDKMEMFCQYYITEIDGKLYHGTKAAKKAGYSQKTAYSAANRLLKTPKVQERIAELKADALEKIGIDQLYILTKMKKIIDDDITNYINFRQSETREEFIDHGSVVLEIKDSRGIDTWNVSEVKKGKDGQFTFKLHDKQKALKDLMEYANIGTGETKGDPDIIIDNFSPVLNMIQTALDSDADE